MNLCEGYPAVTDYGPVIECCPNGGDAYPEPTIVAVDPWDGCPGDELEGPVRLAAWEYYWPGTATNVWPCVE